MLTSPPSVHPSRSRWISTFIQFEVLNLRIGAHVNLMFLTVKPHGRHFLVNKDWLCGVFKFSTIVAYPVIENWYDLYKCELASFDGKKSLLAGKGRTWLGSWTNRKVAQQYEVPVPSQSPLPKSITSWAQFVRIFLAGIMWISFFMDYSAQKIWEFIVSSNKRRGKNWLEKTYECCNDQWRAHLRVLVSDESFCQCNKMV